MGGGISMLSLSFFLSHLPDLTPSCCFARVCSVELCSELFPSSSRKFECHLCKTNPASLNVYIAVPFRVCSSIILSPPVIKSST